MPECLDYYDGKCHSLTYFCKDCPDRKISFDQLHNANSIRQKEWDEKSQIDLSFRGNETAGEIGEAVEEILNLLGLSSALIAAGGRASNIIKKLERERMGIRGSRSSKENLAKELADVIICIDLIASNLKIDLAKAVREKFNESSEKMGLKTLL